MMARRQGPPSIEGLYSLKVDNISYHTSSHDLRRMFDRYGEIGDIHIPRDRHTRSSRGFAFVRFYKRSDAEYALSRNDGRLVDGREIRVSLARYERPIDERGGRDGGGRGGGGGGGRGHDRDDRRRGSDRGEDRERRKRERSRSRSPPSKVRRSRSPVHRSRSPIERSRSRSPTPVKDEEKRSRSASPAGGDVSPQRSAHEASAEPEGNGVKEEARSRSPSRSRSRSKSRSPSQE